MWKPWQKLTDDQWAGVCGLVPELKLLPKGRGRCAADARLVMDGALWVLASTQPWAPLPAQFDSAAWTARVISPDFRST